LELGAFERLLEGIEQACEAEGLAYVGGNLKEGHAVHAVGTALGFCARGKGLRRSGARPGDILMSIGTGGVFWRDALKLLREGVVANKNESPVFRPRSQLSVMHSLAQRDLVRAAIDNSDGLLPTVQQLADASGIGAEIELDELTVENEAPGIDIGADPARLWLGWGDWNVIVAVDPTSVSDVVSTAREAGSVALPIGCCSASSGAVTLVRGDERAPGPRVESERFAADSWFTSGIEGYVELLLTAELPG
jgi:thiamine-monophosphate kinase